MRTIFALLLFWAGAVKLPAQFPEIPASSLPAPMMAFDDGQDSMRARLFQTTTSRVQIDLGGWWDFVADPEDAGEMRGYQARFPEPETRLWAPGTWNSTARCWNYVGAGWYRRRFEMPAHGNLRIHFGGVFYYSKVWLDGRLLGEHEGGYLPFDYTIAGLKKGSHNIVVRADNRLTEASLPKKNVDWFPYGGIDRPVYAEIVPAIFVRRIHVESSLAHPGEARLRVGVVLENLGPAVKGAEIAFSVDGAELYRGNHDAGQGSGTVQFEARLRNPRFWSPLAPNLYSARVVAGPGGDDQFTRFGIREIRTDANRILLNGERLKLRGVNRHEDHPEWGSGSPPSILRQDIEIIKRLGANAVRAHYPLPELFMDFCDQFGLLFLAEVPAWQYSPEQLRDPRIQEKILRCLREMIARDMNHPSVVTWSLGNEWPKPDSSYDVIRSLVQQARLLDPTRLVTFVTGGPHVWRVHELADVICVNWARYQWYDPFTTLEREEGEKSVAALSKIRDRYPGKPVILTELGGAESQAGWHNWGNVKWSEEFQARNVEDSAAHALDEDWISGGCVWQFCDARSAPERFLAGRLHGWNGKGVVDAYRSPKLAFYRLQHIFRSKAEVSASRAAVRSAGE
jgi:beta-glucuronidase